MNLSGQVTSLTFLNKHDDVNGRLSVLKWFIPVVLLIKYMYFAVYSHKQHRT